MIDLIPDIAKMFRDVGLGAEDIDDEEKDPIWKELKKYMEGRKGKIEIGTKPRRNRRNFIKVYGRE